MGKPIVATTELLLREQRYAKGTEFEVVDAPKADATPVQVDPETARRWLREQWATDKPAKKAASS